MCHRRQDQNPASNNRQLSALRRKYIEMKTIWLFLLKKKKRWGILYESRIHFKQANEAKTSNNDGVLYIKLWLYLPTDNITGQPHYWGFQKQETFETEFLILFLSFLKDTMIQSLDFFLFFLVWKSGKQCLPFQKINSLLLIPKRKLYQYNWIIQMHTNQCQLLSIL